MGIGAFFVCSKSKMYERYHLYPNAPEPVGPYSQAIMHNDTLYISGQIAIHPKSGNLVTGTIEEETHQVLQNIQAVLTQQDMTMENVLKCSVFVSDMENYSRINAIYAEYFRESTAPARELVQVARLPKDVNIEISVIAGK